MVETIEIFYMILGMFVSGAILYGVSRNKYNTYNEEENKNIRKKIQIF